MKELLEKLENNRFIYKVRMDLEFDVKDYQELLKILNENCNNKLNITS